MGGQERGAYLIVLRAAVCVMKAVWERCVGRRSGRRVCASVAQVRIRQSSRAGDGRRDRDHRNATPLSGIHFVPNTQTSPAHQHHVSGNRETRDTLLDRDRKNARDPPHMFFGSLTTRHLTSHTSHPSHPWTTHQLIAKASHFAQLFTLSPLSLMNICTQIQSHESWLWLICMDRVNCLFLLRYRPCQSVGNEIEWDIVDMTSICLL
jgi:hypothetical protein